MAGGSAWISWKVKNSRGPSHLRVLPPGALPDPHSKDPEKKPPHTSAGERGKEPFWYIARGFCSSSQALPSKETISPEPHGPKRREISSCNPLKPFYLTKGGKGAEKPWAVTAHRHRLTKRPRPHNLHPPCRIPTAENHRQRQILKEARGKGLTYGGERKE